MYFDYSATTPVLKEVLDTFCKVSKTYIGNPNSLHKLGVESKNLMRQATIQIASLLGVKESEIIYTSGASESNNLFLKGIVEAYPKRGKQIITTALEHSSILEPLLFLETKGYQIDYVNLNADGTVDLNHLESLLSEDTILVTIASVSSELGIEQPIEKIGDLVSKYPKCFFHSDMTQSIGKVSISLKNVDAISFSAHKFYGLKGIGVLVKKEKILLTPQIHGGESTTIYRSGTPALALIVSLAKALRLAFENLEEKKEYVKTLNQLLKEALKREEFVAINSTRASIPHILNFSVMGVRPETFLHALEEDEIYISTKSACSSHKKESLSVLTLYKDEKRASSTLRVSLSYQTTKEEVQFLICKVHEKIQRLMIK